MLEIGALILAASILLVSTLTPVFRHERPPRWTVLPLLAELVAVGITGAVAFGIAFLVAGALDWARHGVSAVHLVLLLAIMALVVLVRRRVRVRALSRAPSPHV